MIESTHLLFYFAIQLFDHILFIFLTYWTIIFLIFHLLLKQPPMIFQILLFILVLTI